MRLGSFQLEFNLILIRWSLNKLFGGDAATQPLPLCLCRLPKSKPKPNPKNPTVRPAWTGASESLTDDKQADSPLLRYKRTPSGQEWCLQSETRLSSNQAANTV